ncbi:hypothetical protein FD25_GL002650 [Levilactobacillus acidifarinae DSM 19394]|uniref:Uncharacterized protein n=1 Tax=Levilactobacillus acidifarinae DSM 19394 = JCM 15949 TaxID=1423715 RepID=A0A0R1LKT6_9LACO|nr:hypothetical protein FD25_GL002650 [Levilactobacillus acidifarinae DSM 19394]
MVSSTLKTLFTKMLTVTLFLLNAQVLQRSTGASAKANNDRQGIFNILYGKSLNHLKIGINPELTATEAKRAKNIENCE